MAFSDCLIASWYGQRNTFKWLSPLAKLYAKQAVKRRESYLKGNKKTYKAPVPIIVVGNITVGGTGKTPMILWLIDYCRNKGLKVGVVSRGYGAMPPKFPWRVLPEHSASQVGDEPLLIVQRTKVPLVIDPKRVNAVKQLLATESVDIILCDDGLQHYALARNLELVMIDAQRRLGNGYCLPMGPLREPIGRLETVDAIINNGAEADTEHGFAMTLEPTTLVNVLTGEQKPLAFFEKAQTIHAIAGIGNPDRFFKTLEKLGWHIIPHPFVDHASYTADMLTFPDQLPIVMTEKDAVKCHGFAQSNWWYLKVDSQPSAGFVKWFEQKLAVLTHEK